MGLAMEGCGSEEEVIALGMRGEPQGREQLGQERKSWVGEGARGGEGGGGKEGG